MSCADFLASFMQAVPEDLSAQILTALREDSLIWQALQEEEFCRLVMASAAEQPGIWNPATLALLSLGAPVKLEDLRSQPMRVLDSSLRQQAAHAYEDLLRGQVPPADLRQAGLAALALRERRRLKGDWEGLPGELRVNSDAGQSVLSIWGSPLACLFAMSSDGEQLLRSLLPKAGLTPDSEWIGLILHAILSIAASPDEHARQINTLLAGYPTGHLLAWLERLDKRGYSGLSAKLAQVFTRSKSSAGIQKTMQIAGKETQAVYAHNSRAVWQQVLDWEEQAELLRYAGQPAQAIEHLVKALNAAQQHQAELAADLARTADMAQDRSASLSAWEQASSLSPKNEAIRAQLTLAKVLQDPSSVKINDLPAKSSDLHALLAAMRAALATGDTNRARTWAKQAFNQYLQNNKLPYQSGKESNQTYPSEDLSDFLDALLNLNLISEALQVGEIASLQRPNDVRLLEQLRRVYHTSGALDKGIETAYLAAVFNPQKIETHRVLAELLEEKSNHASALEQREKVIELSPLPDTADWLALAACALQAGHPDKASEACQVVFKVDKENGLAHALMGEALATSGREELAMDHFTQATLLAPEQSTPWLFLARAQDRAGEHQKSLETLRAAAHAAPQSSEIHLALAEAYLASGSPSEALPSLRKAAQLAPRAANIALRLSKTLTDLGHSGEARQVLERARQASPADPDLAYAHGKTLIALGEPEAAVVAFRTALEGQPHTIDPYIDYASTLLNCLRKRSTGLGFYGSQMIPVSSKTAPDQEIASAQELLEQGMTYDPANVEARILQAQLLYSRGLYDEAFQQFTALSEEPAAQEADFDWRIKLGIGQTSLARKDLETALAALQDAAGKKADELEVHQALTEAYYAANLHGEALQSAYAAQHIAPHDAQNLSWFAHAALAVGAHNEAIAALQRAAQLAPERADVLVFLGKVQMEAGDTISAVATFEAVIKSSQATPADLQEAAHAMLHLDNVPAAIACLERAIQQSPLPTAELLTELAQLLQKRGDLPGALEVIQRASQAHTGNPDLFVMQADVLAQMNRLQAALGCLEEAQQLHENGTGKTQDESNYLALQIHIRFARWLRQSGEVARAYRHAQIALDLFPGLPETHYYAGELAFAMIDRKGLQSILDWKFPANTSSPEYGSDPSLPITAVEHTVGILSLQMEAALEIGNYEEVERLAKQAENVPLTPRWMTILARVKHHQGEHQIAEQLLQTALATLENGADGDQVSQTANEFTPALGAAARAALDLGHWTDSVRLSEKVAESHPMEPRAHLDLACAITRCAEFQRISPDYHIQAHVPGPEALNEDRRHTFEQAIDSAGRLSGSPEVNRWRTRGMMTFMPNAKIIEVFINVDRTSSDTAALLAGLRLMDDLDTMGPVSQACAQDPRIAAEMALAWLDQDNEKALAYALTCIEGGSAEPYYLALVAYIAESCGQLQVADESIQKALSIWPEEPQWHALASRIRAAYGDRAGAIHHLKQALNLEPNAPDYALNLGQIYLEEGSVQTAVQALALAVRLAPESPDPWMALARAHQLAGDLGQALSCVDRAVALAPTLVKPVVLKGELALDAGKTDEAFQQVEAALALEPNDPEAILLNAHVLISQGRVPDALATLEKAIPLIPEPLHVLLEQIRLIRQTQGAQSALPKAQGLVERYPDEPEAAELLASLLVDVGQREAAEQAAQRALQLQPDNPRMHFLLGHMMRASGQLDQAIHHLSEVIQVESANLEASLELGRAYQDRRDHISALKAYRQAIKIAPKDPRPYYQAGLALRETKDYKGAETMLRHAAELSPDDVNIRRQLGAVIAINLVHNSQEANTSS